MITNQIIQATIDDIKGITRTDICVLDMEGTVIAATLEWTEEYQEQAELFAQSPADSQQVQGSHYLKVYDRAEPVYLLILQGGEDAYMVGRLAVSQLQRLIEAYKERYDKNSFIKGVLMNTLPQPEIYVRAKQLHIALHARRAVFIIETEHNKDSMALETVKSLINDKNRDFVVPVDEKHILVVRELTRSETLETLAGVADMFVDMLNTEAMIKTHVSYGTVVYELQELSRSYREAMTAQEVGSIFYSDRTSIAYSSLGIGRLIYQLPLNLCEMFLNEVLEGHAAEEIDEETLAAIHKFFETNLNISEAARQLYVHRNTLTYRLDKIEKMTGLDIKTFEDAMTFKMAWMVADYMKYKKREVRTKEL